ncbi:MAG: hypothetical protein A2X52_18740 [Candidatus Rokubacteria bacterium GWC2_70_16]|nr:MAG: hypothetical protein A2X52_18740 [Candidatus Rokubacteria bacterium GWC2_70_16]
MARWQHPRPAVWILLAFLVLGVVGQAVPLYTDWLWFHEVGFPQVFTTMLALRGWLVLGLGAAVFAFLFANLWVAARTAPPDVLWELEDQLGLPGRAVLEPLVRRLLLPVIAVIALASGARGSGEWDTLLQYLNATPFGRTDPLFNRDIGFYVFQIPFWRLLYGWAMALGIGTLVLTAAVYVLQRSVVLTAGGPRLAAGARTHLLGLGALLLVLRGVGFWLDRYDLLYSPRGFVFGASYTDVNAALPVLRVLAVLALLCAAACVVQMRRPGWLFLVAGLVVLAVVWIGGLGAYPALLQRFRVTPNELVAEGPYIQHSIRMTRQAYGIDRVQEKDFPADESLNAAALERNNLTVKNIRLWDHRPLLTTYGQLQEIRTYYKFLDVDNDRYMIGGEYRQVMLSPRELSYKHLPGQGQSWINEHLTYTHGYGLVVGPVNRISAEGLPEFFVKDIPPAASGFPKITRPEMYYGESGNEYVFVRTKSQELDYPSGDQNVYGVYAGRGGIVVDSLLKKLAFAARFGEIKVLLSDDLTTESRVMIYREIGRRVRQAAPFLRFDRDPYLVVTEDGRLVWMIDGYTTSDRYPYAQPVRGMGNYIRNSVKATVDAFHGTLTYYIADAEDPVIRTWAKAFPGLLKPFSQMPKDLQAHVRYPEDLFTIQAQMYATYHMEDPQVFYNKEDLWTIPRRQQDARTASEMEPYYTIMRLPGEPREEFVLLNAFNPSRRDNMIAIMAARSDAPNYGGLLVYMFPKQKLVYGPRQIDARIDQDGTISQQLSLWNQQGSRVLRGSLLAIPIDQSLVYVQPLYLAATEQGALPELRRVIVAYGNQIAMEPTLEQSLGRIFGARVRGDEAAARPREAAAPGPPRLETGLRPLVQRAWEAWQKGQEALRRGDWTGYGQEQKRVEETLRQLREGR